MTKSFESFLAAVDLYIDEVSPTKTHKDYYGDIDYHGIRQAKQSPREAFELLRVTDFHLNDAITYTQLIEDTAREVMQRAADAPDSGIGDHLYNVTEDRFSDFVHPDDLDNEDVERMTLWATRNPHALDDIEMADGTEDAQALQRLNAWWSFNNDVSDLCHGGLCDPGGCPGWAVFNSNEIQRCDTCKLFANDLEAEKFVNGQHIRDPTAVNELMLSILEENGFKTTSCHAWHGHYKMHVEFPEGADNYASAFHDEGITLLVVLPLYRLPLHCRCITDVLRVFEMISNG